MNCCFDELNFSLLVPSGKGRSEKKLAWAGLGAAHRWQGQDEQRTHWRPAHTFLRASANWGLVADDIPKLVVRKANHDLLSGLRAKIACCRGRLAERHSPSPNTAKCYLQPGKTLRRWFCLLISCFKLSISSLSAFASSVSPWVLVSASLYLYWMYWSGEILTKLRSLQCLA